jgi:hypothetical protein
MGRQLSSSVRTVTFHHHTESDCSQYIPVEGDCRRLQIHFRPLLEDDVSSGRDQPQIDYDEAPYHTTSDYLLRSTLSGETSAESLLRYTLSGETAADTCCVYLWLTKPQPTRCYAFLCPVVLRYIRPSSPLRSALSTRTTADYVQPISATLGVRLSSPLRSIYRSIYRDDS